MPIWDLKKQILQRSRKVVADSTAIVFEKFIELQCAYSAAFHSVSSAMPSKVRVRMMAATEIFSLPHQLMQILIYAFSDYHTEVTHHCHRVYKGGCPGELLREKVLARSWASMYSYLEQAHWLPRLLQLEHQPQ